MKDKIIENRKKTTTIFTIIAILLFISSLSLIIYDFVLEQSALNISCKITSIDYSGGKSTAHVKYTVSNTDYENVISLPDDSEYTINDMTQIKINMKNPRQQISNNHYLIALIIFLISLLLGIINLPKFIKNAKRNKRVKELKKLGFYIKATPLEIFANNKGKKYKKIYPYRLRCQYLNPQDNKQYLFESEDTFLNLQEIIRTNNATTVNVYINKTNTNDYYVDLSSLEQKINIIDPISFMKNK